MKGSTRKEKGMRVTGKTFEIDYTYNGQPYKATVTAMGLKSAKNKIGKQYKLNAEETAKQIRVSDIKVIGFKVG